MIAVSIIIGGTNYLGMYSFEAVENANNKASTFTHRKGVSLPPILFC